MAWGNIVTRAVVLETDEHLWVSFHIVLILKANIDQYFFCYVQLIYEACVCGEVGGGGGLLLLEMNKESVMEQNRMKQKKG